MNNTKINLSITLQGKVMKSEQECSERPMDNYGSFTLNVQDSKTNLYERLWVKYRKACNKCTQVIHISEEAYKFYISEDTPYKEKASNWKQLPIQKRLEYHLNKICEAMGGTSFTYSVIE